ncbi:MAG: FAD-dependent oxidoreductase [Desulfovibrio sp.]|jgi:formate dehydrogenase major subunit|nr:FAD-dependent oxidoreductase [Desulfovibrio sp.]
MDTITVNGKQIDFLSGETVLAAVQRAGVFIPTLCHDERVTPYASCGVCVVELEGSPRLVRACSTMVAAGQSILTDSPRALATRKAALALLLSDHRGDCRPPCVEACPGKTDCQGYVGLLANGEYMEALTLIKERLPLPASIGRVCPRPCETACRRKLVEEPISIAQLKYHIADHDLRSGAYLPEVATDSGKKVAIIGGGPGGLTAAFFLRKQGHQVDVLDMMPEMGGMLRYGIPEYRLPKKVLAEEIALIAKMGVHMRNNVRLGTDMTLDGLAQTYDAVVIAIGAWKSIGMRIPGENLQGVDGGIDFLRRVHFEKVDLTGKRVAIVGGGNTAMDACRTAVRLNAAHVYTVYRRTKAEMPADAIEIEEAEEEGVIFKYLANPLEILGENGIVKRISLQKMRLGEPDASGRRSPVPIEGDIEIMDVDLVIMAIGQQNDNTGLDGLSLTKRGTIAADETSFRTSIEKIFAIGDATNRGADIAITAIGEARMAAGVIGSFLEGEMLPYRAPVLVKREDLTESDFADREKAARVKMRHRSAKERRSGFSEVNLGYSAEEAKREASRCLECGCLDYFECKLLDYVNRYGVKPVYPGEARKYAVSDEHPYITRNMEKCVLCGLCVRICEEVVGVAALGLVNRGFSTVVAPEMRRPLKETSCISCGMCVSLCPTGALLEKTAQKPVPVREELTKTACNLCEARCGIIMATRGDLHLRNLPVEGGLLCEKGRFAFLNGETSDKQEAPPEWIVRASSGKGSSRT